MTTDPTAETARALLYRHGLPEDVIDGALALFAQELAGKIRAYRDHTRGVVQATKVMNFAADLISPESWARTEPAPAAAGVAPAADQTASDRVRAVCEQLRRASVLADGQPHTDRERGIVHAVDRVHAALDAEPRQPAADQTGLRDRIAEKIKRAPFRELSNGGLPNGPLLITAYVNDLADAVLAVLPDQQAAIRAAALREGADAIDRETQQAKADGVLEPDKFRPCRDASAQLRRMAAGAQQQGDTETADDPIGISRELCPGFPDRCPNLRTVDPEPGVHLGGIRCGCADAPAPVAEQPAAEHTGGNAEDCPVCRPEIDKTVLYPWICTAAKQQPAADGEEQA